MTRERKGGLRVVVVCGPTASGKSGVADEISERLTAATNRPATTIVIDSMQVYREIPQITNQPRARPAELTGIVSVTEAWTVARHRAAVDASLITDNTNATSGGFVLDAGTGMYLNAILMDIDLAPRVDADVRAEAVRQTQEAERGGGEPGGRNARREARRRELELARTAPRGSIWTNRTRLDADILYLRPPRHATDAAIEARSSEIVSRGIPEARHLLELAWSGTPPTPQVIGSIGVRELTEYLAVAYKGLTREEEAARLEEARHRISVRTRQLARRQVRWFDKMAHTLQGTGIALTVAEGPSDRNAQGFLERSVRATRT